MRFACAVIVMLAAMTFANGCNKSKPKPTAKPSSTNPRSNSVWPESPHKNNPTEELIFQTNLSEDMILDLSPGLKVLAAKFAGDQANLNSIFAETIEYAGPSNFDFLSDEVKENPTAAGHVVNFDWPVDMGSEVVSPDAIWAEILDAVIFEEPQFGVLSGTPVFDYDVFQMKTVFESRFQDQSGRRFGVKAHQTLEWKPVADGTWKIHAWQQDEFKITYSPIQLFENVTQDAIPENATFESVTRAGHDHAFASQFDDSSQTPVANPKHPFFSDWESAFQYPAASVVDIDGDQWDDLFVMDRRGDSILLRNNGDKTFTDITKKSGLSVGEYANCALFADFDNDGDQDVFVGRTLEPSLFFRNDNGKFTPDAKINENLKDVKFVVSASLADINRDGLLDIYLSTYCFTGGDPDKWVPEVVRPIEAMKLKTMIDRNNPFLDRGGPPNIVLMNRGGTLERASVDNTLRQWRSSYQSVWHDIDKDGDADLYVCNDFSPDVFLRNDTPRGSFEPKFVDITDEVFPDGAMGFGMGANFGDYNSDGEMDLYVSNMYSKAGLRIQEKLGGNVDPRIKASAEGNFLYENRNGKFTQVAGNAEDKKHVSKVGWSFGGQFADFNNDQDLDLYVSSGFFSPPARLTSTVDL